MRAILLALSFALAPVAALALEPSDVLGRWETQWSNQANEAVSGGAPMNISLDSPEALDGTWPAPGADGVIYGEVIVQPDGALVWSGTWAHLWPESVSRGTFRFVFTDANSFSGTWSTADGAVKNAVWNGQRAN